MSKSHQLMPKANKIPPLQEIEPKPSVRYVARFRGDCADGWRYQRSTKEGGEPGRNEAPCEIVGCAQPV